MNTLLCICSRRVRPRSVQFPQNPACHQGVYTLQVTITLSRVARDQVVRFSKVGHNSDHPKLTVLPKLVNHFVVFSNDNNVWALLGANRRRQEKEHHEH